MYSEFFPALVKKYGCQIILVSHNPLILSEPIMENDVYSIISLDEAYTNDVKGLLKGVRF
jgi:predicted ATPase